MTRYAHIDTQFVVPDDWTWPDDEAADPVTAMHDAIVTLLGVRCEACICPPCSQCDADEDHDGDCDPADPTCPGHDCPIQLQSGHICDDQHCQTTAVDDALDEARAALDRVRAEHTSTCPNASVECGAEHWCEGCGHVWPCPTIRAIDGPRAEEAS